jgi:hypothetical protein
MWSARTRSARSISALEERFRANIKYGEMQVGVVDDRLPTTPPENLTIVGAILLGRRVAPSASSRVGLFWNRTRGRCKRELNLECV